MWDIQRFKVHSTNHANLWRLQYPLEMELQTLSLISTARLMSKMGLIFVFCFGNEKLRQSDTSQAWFYGVITCPSYLFLDLLSSVFKLGPDRPVEPVEPGTGQVAGPSQLRKPEILKLGQSRSKTGFDREKTGFSGSTVIFLKKNSNFIILCFDPLNC